MRNIAYIALAHIFISRFVCIVVDMDFVVQARGGHGKQHLATARAEDKVRLLSTLTSQRRAKKFLQESIGGPAPQVQANLALGSNASPHIPYQGPHRQYRHAVAMTTDWKGAAVRGHGPHQRSSCVSEEGQLVSAVYSNLLHHVVLRCIISPCKIT